MALRRMNIIRQKNWALKYKGESRARGLVDEGRMGVAQAGADARTLKAKGKNTLSASILEGFGEGAKGYAQYRYNKSRRRDDELDFG